MFLIVDINSISHIICRQVYDLTLCPFHMCSSNYVLVIVLGLKVKENVYMAETLLFYILKKTVTVTEVAYF
jgi:hypothetical protein